MPVNAKSILITVSGGVFVYSGIKGLPLSLTLRDLISGRNPSKDAATFAKYNIDPYSPEAGALADGTAPPPGKIHKPTGKANPGPGHNYISPHNIYLYARQAGFSASEAVVATAIALAESIGGDANAHCLDCVPGVHEDSRGLWQINVLAHPWAAASNLYDPQVNAAAAYQVYHDAGKKFTPWSTYTSGSYKSRLPAAMKAAGKG